MKTRNENLEIALKMAYRYAMADMSVGTEELIDHLTDALCELIGDEGFQSFINAEEES